MENAANKEIANSTVEDVRTKKFMPKIEIASYFARVIGTSSWNGVTSTYKNLFLTAVLFAGFNYEVDIAPKLVAMTIIVAIVEILTQPIAAMLVSRTNTKYGRFRPYGFIFMLPLTLFGALMMISPAGLSLNGKIIYITIVTSLFSICNVFMGQSYNIQQVMSPNDRERGKWIGISGIVGTVGSVVPMGVFWVMARFMQEDKVYTPLAIVVAIFMLLCFVFYYIKSTERVSYNPVKVKINTAIFKPFKYKPFVLYQSTIILRSIAGFTGIVTPFLAGVAMGVDKAILFSLPTGAGTVVGLLLCNVLMKKIKPLYLMRGIGIYSIIVATITTLIGPFGGAAFYIFYFMYGITYGFHNVIPNIINADVMDYLEWKTGQRLDASAGLVVGYLNKLVVTLRDAMFVIMLAWAGYKAAGVGQSIFEANAANREATARILLLYAVGIPGLFFFFISIIYFFFDLNGKKKEQMIEGLTEMRACFARGEKYEIEDDNPEDMEYDVDVENFDDDE